MEEVKNFNTEIKDLLSHSELTKDYLWKISKEDSNFSVAFIKSCTCINSFYIFFKTSKNKLITNYVHLYTGNHKNGNEIKYNEFINKVKDILNKYKNSLVTINGYNIHWIDNKAKLIFPEDTINSKIKEKLNVSLKKTENKVFRFDFTISGFLYEFSFALSIDDNIENITRFFNSPKINDSVLFFKEKINEEINRLNSEIKRAEKEIEECNSMKDKYSLIIKEDSDLEKQLNNILGEDTINSRKLLKEIK